MIRKHSLLAVVIVALAVGVACSSSEEATPTRTLTPAPTPTSDAGSSGNGLDGSVGNPIDPGACVGAPTFDNTARLPLFEQGKPLPPIP